MKTIAFLIALGLVSCAALEGATPKDAQDALTQARNACAIGQTVTADERVHAACEALEKAGDAAREAAEAVLEVTK
jgi:hypothetical protein